MHQGFVRKGSYTKQLRCLFVCMSLYSFPIATLADEAADADSANKYINILKSDLETIKKQESKVTKNSSPDFRTPIEILKSVRTDNLWWEIGDVLRHRNASAMQNALHQATEKPYVDLIELLSSDPSPATAEEWFYDYLGKIRHEVEGLLKEQEAFVSDIDSKQGSGFDWSITDQQLRKQLAELHLVFSTLELKYKQGIQYHYMWTGRSGAFEKAKQSDIAMRNSRYIEYIHRLISTIRHALNVYLDEPKSCYWEDETIKCDYIASIIAVENMPGNCKPDPKIKQASGEMTDERYEGYMAAIEQQYREMNKDITFHGRVVDGNSNPVPNAKVYARVESFNENFMHQSQCARHPEFDYSELANNVDTVSDETGSFEIEGERGYRLRIRDITKYGYSRIGTLKEFSYNRPKNEPGYGTSANPFTFVMHREITAEDLE